MSISFVSTSFSAEALALVPTFFYCSFVLMNFSYIWISSRIERSLILDFRATSESNKLISSKRARTGSVVASLFSAVVVFGFPVAASFFSSSSGALLDSFPAGALEAEALPIAADPFLSFAAAAYFAVVADSIIQDTKLIKAC